MLGDELYDYLETDCCQGNKVGAEENQWGQKISC